jgi:hypothetical protein
MNFYRANYMAFVRQIESMKFLPRTLLALVASSALSLFGQQAQARLITGEIDFNGVVTFDTLSLATATQVTSWNNPDPPFVIPGSQTGDFGPSAEFSTGIADFANVTMTAPWTFNSGTPGTPLPGPPLNSLWSVGSFTFNLTSSMVVSQSATFLDVEGVGTLTSTNGNLDPTAGTWSFTSSRADGQTSNTFSFQSETVVPEANTLVLLGLGGTCLMVSMLARRKAKTP